ncbi:hypothetical protein HPB51_022885 [Rhipicephalus microplus]|uniref:Uncharacterized protein n=1 Tax=Rhipicephalus microplus TaxID=6941 RepID=A0A9J6DR14_RHIMP|nr:hypothetical protein HPB51_022885 [Rhipicephalus microplus]
MVYRLRYSAADPQVAGSNPGCGGCISDVGENVVGPCAQILVHVKELQSPWRLPVSFRDTAARSRGFDRELRQRCVASARALRRLRGLLPSRAAASAAGGDQLAVAQRGGRDFFIRAADGGLDAAALTARPRLPRRVTWTAGVSSRRPAPPARCGAFSFPPGPDASSAQFVPPALARASPLDGRTPPRQSREVSEDVSAVLCPESGRPGLESSRCQERPSERAADSPPSSHPAQVQRKRTPLLAPLSRWTAAMTVTYAKKKTPAALAVTLRIRVAVAGAVVSHCHFA